MNIALYAIIGIILLVLAGVQWYDLYQIEQGLKVGELSVVLVKIYDVAGKWGVAGFYGIFALYCFWRAYKIFKISSDMDDENLDDNND